VPAVASRSRAKRVPQGGPAAAPAEQLQASLKTSLGLKVRSIMLDPGHGGHDPGATADGLHEKDVALAIALRLKEVLQARHPDLKIGMTRSDDAFVPLNRRPELAKAFGADLFVSIHLNANPIRRFSGVETYFLNLTSDAGALAVAARENATSEKKVSDLNGILLDLLRDTNILESSKLASALQTSLVERLRDANPVRDLGVKQAPFMVLIGAEMPSVLVEAGFVTNPEESRRLKDPGYVSSIAEGIHAGLQKYIEDLDVAADRRAMPPSQLLSHHAPRASR
jgi:N-acetylmuramoyl-L-alanine amidase